MVDRLDPLILFSFSLLVLLISELLYKTSVERNTRPRAMTTTQFHNHPFAEIFINLTSKWDCAKSPILLFQDSGLKMATAEVCTSKKSVSPVKIQLISRRKSLTLPTLRVSVYGTTIINFIDRRKPSNTGHLHTIVQVQKFNGLFIDLGTPLPRRMAFPAFRPSGWYG